jgi:transposase InsO family protein
VIDVWSLNVVAWDIAEREDPAIAADLVSRASLRERISKGLKYPLILRADNGSAMRAATLESRLEELSLLRSFSSQRESNDNTNSESLVTRPNIGLIIPADDSPVRSPRANGLVRLWTGTTTGTATAKSNS